MRVVTPFICLALLLFISCEQEVPSSVKYGEGGGLSNPELDQTVDNLRRDLYAVAWVTERYDAYYDEYYYYYQVALSKGKEPLEDATVRMNSISLSPYYPYDSSFAYYYYSEYEYTDISSFSLNIETPDERLITGSLMVEGTMEIVFPPQYYHHPADSPLTVVWSPILNGTRYFKVIVEDYYEGEEIYSSGLLSGTDTSHTIPGSVFDPSYYSCYIWVYGYEGQVVAPDSTHLPRNISGGISGASGYFVGILSSEVYIYID